MCDLSHLQDKVRKGGLAELNNIFASWDIENSLEGVDTLIARSKSNWLGGVGLESVRQLICSDN